MTDPIKEFWDLCREASIAWEKTADTIIYEPYLLKILKHVKSNIEFREEFQNCFIQIIKKPEIAIWEIVMYCMRELRWEKVYKMAKEEHLSSDDIRNKNILESIMAVFDDDWEDSDLFKYYSK